MFHGVSLTLEHIIFHEIFMRIVSVPDHCLSFYFVTTSPKIIPFRQTVICLLIEATSGQNLSLGVCDQVGLKPAWTDIASQCMRCRDSRMEYNPQ